MFVLSANSVGVCAEAVEAEPSAVVSLIGTEGAGAELSLVLSELLERSHVKAEIFAEGQFDPDSVLAAAEDDARIWIFVVIRDGHDARLYFRGPFGKRFLLRELSLPNGLDEVGRELIGQVVESSSVALLHSGTGMTRDEATASLSREREAAPANAPAAPAKKPAPPRPSTTSERRATVVFAIGEHEFVQWTQDGGPALGIGGEAALGVVLPPGWALRGRIGGDYRAPESVTRAGVGATYSSFGFRGGGDIGKGFGPHAVYLGLFAGADVNHAEARASASGVRATPASDGAAAVLRAELRYELTAGQFFIAAGPFADFATARTHYDLAEGRKTVRVVELWMVRPGISITLGWSTPGARDTGAK